MPYINIRVGDKTKLIGDRIGFSNNELCQLVFGVDLPMMKNITCKMAALGRYLSIQSVNPTFMGSMTLCDIHTYWWRHKSVHTIRRHDHVTLALELHSKSFCICLTWLGECPHSFVLFQWYYFLTFRKYVTTTWIASFVKQRYISYRFNQAIGFAMNLSTPVNVPSSKALLVICWFVDCEFNNYISHCQIEILFQVHHTPGSKWNAGMGHSEIKEHTALYCFLFLSAFTTWRVIHISYKLLLNWINVDYSSSLCLSPLIVCVRMCVWRHFSYFD